MLSRIKSGVRAFLGADASSVDVTPTPAITERPSGEAEALTYDPSADTPCPAEPILTLEQCPVCGGAESTRVSRYNRFVLFDRTPDAASAIYN